MTKISIPNFLTHTPQSLYIHLLRQNDTEFEIIIPREKLAGIDENNDILFEYLLAAYAGQLLSQVATSFAYYVPCPKRNDSIYFRVIVPDLEKFTDTLYLIIQGFNYSSDDDLNSDFSVDASYFLSNAYDEDYECNTWGLLHIASQYLDP